MKIVLEIELLSPGKWGLDMASQDGAATVVHACGENLTEQAVEAKIAYAVEQIMFQLSGGSHDEFPSASKGPEEL